MVQSRCYHNEGWKSLGKIIGITDFQYDGQFLDDYVTKVIKLWKGEREPVGVDIEDSGRCQCVLIQSKEFMC